MRFIYLCQFLCLFFGIAFGRPLASFLRISGSFQGGFWDYFADFFADAVKLKKCDPGIILGHQGGHETSLVFGGGVSPGCLQKSGGSEFGEGCGPRSPYHGGGWDT